MATPTTLPATQTTGNVLTASWVNDLRGAFRILQVVQSTYSSYTLHNNTTYNDTGLSATITPSATSSKILVLAFNNGTVKGAEASGNALNLQLLRGSTQIQEVQNLHLSATSLLMVGTCHVQILDSPNTTSAVTYKMQGKNSVSSSTVGTQFGSTTSTMVLMEVSA